MRRASASRALARALSTRLRRAPRTGCRISTLRSALMPSASVRRSRLGRQLVHQDQRRRRLVGIELGEEGGEHLGQRQVAVMAGEIGAIAEIAAAAEEEDLDAGMAAGLMGGDHIGVADALDIDVLMGLDHGERPQPVAQRGGAARNPGRRWPPASGSPSRACTSRLRPARKSRACSHEAGVILQGDPPDAGRRAALDLIEQAGPGAAGEDAVGAGAQQEGALQRRDGAVHGAGGSEGTVVVALARPGAAMLGDLRGGHDRR